MTLPVSATVEEVTLYYEKKIVAIERKCDKAIEDLKQKNLADKQKLKAKYESGEAYDILRKEINRLNNNNKELQDMVFFLRGEAIRYRRVAEAEMLNAEECKRAKLAAEAERDKAKRTVVNLSKWVKKQGRK